MGETMRILLEAKAKTEAKDKEGRTALILAAGFRNSEAVRVLLDAKAKIDCRDKFGKTAAQIVKEKGYEEIKKAISFEKKRRKVRKKFRMVKKLANETEIQKEKQ